MTTKILALTDALGSLVRFPLMPGQPCDSVEVPLLIDGIAFAGLIADKAFDSNALFAELNSRGARIVISQHPARPQSSRSILRSTHGGTLIANFLCKLKESKCIAMRACKTDRSFEGMIHLVAAVLNAR